MMIPTIRPDSITQNIKQTFGRYLYEHTMNLKTYLMLYKKIKLKIKKKNIKLLIFSISRFLKWVFQLSSFLFKH